MSKDNNNRNRIVGTSENPFNIDYDSLKKGLDSEAKKSPFSNFFNGLKPQELPTHQEKDQPTDQE